MAQAETPVETPGAADPLAGTQWNLETFGPAGAETPLVSGSTITLEFGEDDQAGGSGGCNTYGGEYQVQDGALSLGEIISTEKACLEEGVMEQEQRYYEALQTAAGFELAGDRLTITYDAGQGRLNFVK
jgi:heat shock protein HslJ